MYGQKHSSKCPQRNLQTWILIFSVGTFAVSNYIENDLAIGHNTLALRCWLLFTQVLLFLRKCHIHYETCAVIKALAMQKHKIFTCFLEGSRSYLVLTVKLMSGVGYVCLGGMFPVSECSILCYANAVCSGHWCPAMHRAEPQEITRLFCRQCCLIRCITTAVWKTVSFKHIGINFFCLIE